MDYVLDEHLDFKPTWSICNTISDNIVIQLIWKFQESKWNPDWFIALMDSFGTNYIFTNNKNLGQYDQNAIPSQIMPCYSYPGNLINQNKIPIELTCQQAHLGLIMSLMSMKMLANMVHMWYSLRWCHVTGILQVCLIIWNPYWLIVLMSSSESDYVPNEHEDADQYDSYTIPSKIMPYQSYPKSLVNQNEIPSELSC